ncbi:MAG: zf-TFIIB domain-containing protein [Nitrospirae bacterium]|nr:zf-TFIIB domain-containing protein [Nitrospirota bacterium]
MAKELGEHGYDREEEYFYKKNKELLDKMRKELDAKRAKQEAESKKNPHWMKCPKCGKDLEEVHLAGIKVDQCTNCLGIYFDQSELELLLGTQEREGFLEGLIRLFRK